jgi:hypothetical protein
MDRKADISSSAAAKNALSYTSTPPYTYSWRGETTTKKLPALFYSENWAQGCPKTARFSQTVRGEKIGNYKKMLLFQSQHRGNYRLIFRILSAGISTKIIKNLEK